MLAIPKGMDDAASIIFLVLLVGGAFAVVSLLFCTGGAVRAVGQSKPPVLDHPVLPLGLSPRHTGSLADYSRLEDSGS